MTQHRPIVLWIDDEPEHLSRFSRLQGEDSQEWEFVFITDTDEAIEFALQHGERIFMYIQDSSRGRSKIIDGWRAVRPTHIPAIGLDSVVGGFCTYVVDGLSPGASQVFAGYGYGHSELDIIHRWARLDSRVAEKDKYELCTGRDEDGARGAHPFIREQLARWKQLHIAGQLSPEVDLLAPAGDELAVVCGTRPGYIDKLTPRQFEEVVAAVLANHGFTVEVTSKTRDGGYDIVAVSHSSLPNEVVLVEVKHFAPGRPVEVGIVRALYGVKHLHKASRALLVTSSYVSTYAKREFQRVMPLELDLVERPTFLSWCESYVSQLLSENDCGENVKGEG